MHSYIHTGYTGQRGQATHMCIIITIQATLAITYNIYIHTHIQVGGQGETHTWEHNTHTRIRTYIHTYIITYTYQYTGIYANNHVSIHIYNIPLHTQTYNNTGSQRIRTYTHTHAYMHTHIHAGTHTITHACMHTHMHTYIHAYMHTDRRAYGHSHMDRGKRGPPSHPDSWAYGHTIMIIYNHHPTIKAFRHQGIRTDGPSGRRAYDTDITSQCI